MPRLGASFAFYNGAEAIQRSSQLITAAWRTPERKPNGRDLKTALSKLISTHCARAGNRQDYVWCGSVSILIGQLTATRNVTLMTMLPCQRRKQTIRE